MWEVCPSETLPQLQGPCPWMRVVPAPCNLGLQLGRGKCCSMRGVLEKTLTFPSLGKSYLMLSWSFWLGFIVDT